MILLDIHALVWRVADASRLGGKARRPADDGASSVRSAID